MSDSSACSSRLDALAVSEEAARGGDGAGGVGAGGGGDGGTDAAGGGDAFICIGETSMGGAGGGFALSSDRRSLLLRIAWLAA
eukprot:scaffold893_cov336-Prasinococcus_capsulatus_cf.AAC.8